MSLPERWAVKNKLDFTEHNEKKASLSKKQFHL